jgi:NAD(P)-dependent dehydrogenase (short-subunit alcohol dehydrogenase family)
MEIEFALVTGAGRGIGRAITLELGKTHTHLVCISQSKACVATADTIKRGGGSAEAVVLEISDLERCERVVADIVARYRPERIGLVLAAAILGRPGGLVNGPPLEEWAKVYRTNVLGNLAVLRGCLPRMLETKFARVVVLAGGGAAYAYPEFSAYALSKTAIVRAVENAAAELQSAGDFSFVALAPGAVETDMLAQVRAAGGTVKTTTSASEAVQFVSKYFASDGNALSGRFVHVRDEWQKYMSSGQETLKPCRWTLRRIE